MILFFKEDGFHPIIASDERGQGKRTLDSARLGSWVKLAVLMQQVGAQQFVSIASVCVCACAFAWSREDFEYLHAAER